ncbi:ABC transporter permease [Bacteroides sp.]
MMRIYFKQAWELMKQNRLFSTLYIVGTGLAIAMTMVIAIVHYVKLAPIYPEENRSQTFYLSNSSFKRLDIDGMSNWAFSYQAVKEWFYTLKNVEAVSATYSGIEEANYIQPDDGSGDFPVSVKLTDPTFFRIYPFRFLEGKPFTDADFSSGMRSAVITDDLARRLFGQETGVTGRTFKMNFIDCRVSGVVHSASYLTPKSFAQIYLPYSCEPDYDKSQHGVDYMGAYQLTFLVSSSEQAEALRKEIREIVRKYNFSQKQYELDIWEQPVSHILSVFQEYPGNKDFSWGGLARHYLLILIVLLLVPALNLGGMISSRMESRLPEMGVRKSFGAPSTGLLKQVMWENLLLTLLGGLLGLILAWIALFVARDWVFYLFDSWPEQLPEGITATVSGEMFFAPMVFVAALVLCIVLNILSALLPAWCSLRKPIVNSLNEKR